LAKNDLESITFSEGLEKIGISALKGNKFESIILPEGLKVIGSYALDNNNLKEIIIPESVERIEFFAFFENQELKKAIIKGNPYIGDCAFPQWTEIIYSNPNVKRLKRI